jgi:hypothetical protein
VSLDTLKCPTVKIRIFSTKLSTDCHDITEILLKVAFNTITLTLMNYHFDANRIGGIMVSVLTSSAVDRGFEPWSGQTKDYKIGICCFSAKHAT